MPVRGDSRYYRLLASCLAGDLGKLAGEFRQPAWNWETLIAVASEQSLLPIVHPVLAAAGLLPTLPRDVADFFFAARELNRGRNAEIIKQLETLAAGLNQVGIEPLVLKGAAQLLEGVYADPADRFLLDIDLLVPPADITNTVEVLRSLGYSNAAADPIDLSIGHTYPLISKPGSVPIDLHRSMGLAICRKLLPAEEVLQSSAIYQLGNARLRIPSPEHLVVHHIMHSQLHESYRDRIWTPLRSMYDLMLLQRQFGNQIDWPRISQRFKRHGRYGILALYLLRVEDVLGMKPPIPASNNPLLRMRLLRRNILRAHPALRLIDPFWFYFAGTLGRARRLREIWGQKGGGRYLLRKLFSRGFFSRLKADLS